MSLFQRTAAALAALFLLAGPADATTLRYGGATPALTMDPHSTNDFVTAAVNRQIYDSVVGIDDRMELTQGLAVEWTFQAPETWRFKLRPGVKFHDGTPMTAEDVAFSVQRQKVSPLYRALFGTVKDAIRIDDTTVDVISNGPDPILPRKMTKLFVMSKAWSTANNVEKVPDLGAQGTEAYSLRHANGTGPMKLVVHEPGRRTAFARNRDYWAPGAGNVDEAVYTTIGAAPTRVAALLSGELDLISDMPLQDIERVKATPNFKVQQAPQQLYMHIEMDGTRDVALDIFDKAGQPLKANPLKDVRVRRAFAHAIDAKLIVERVMRGHGIVIGTGAAEGFAGYQKDLDVRWPTDIALAKSLLTQAGYPDGFIVQLNCPLERYTNTEEICRATASMLARIGVEVRVKGMVWPEFARMLVNGPNSSFHLIGGSGNSGDLQDAFVSIMATRDRDKGRGGTNWAMWTNAEFDAVVDELVKTVDPARRTELYRKGLTIGRDMVHSIYLHQPVLTWGMKQSVTMAARADSAIMLHTVVMK
ncbi:MAG: ABC transporter substrate-binding protein [Rhodospirillales bacterium]|nr:ABC transporter substrate-binding protein [Rhodospirillales bacterium]